MKDLIADIERWQREGEDIAVATLVRAKGSTPRRAGARLCITRAGEMTGSVSGGCVETDVYQRAVQVMDENRCALARYTVEDDIGLEVGLSCGGVIDVLIEPFTDDPAWQAFASAVTNHRQVALCLAMEPESLLGRKRVLLDAGAAVGSIAPELDAQLSSESEGFPSPGTTGNLVLPFGDAKATIFVEHFAPAPRLFIVGGTHTAMVLCRFATEVGFRVTVIDAREPFARPERFPDAEQVVMAWPDQAFDGLGLDADSYVVTLAHDPKFDIPTLERALSAGAIYVGAMGSRGTKKRRWRLLREAGVADVELQRIRAPIGLDLGGRSPVETAIAIVAEMLAVRYGRDGQALSSGAGTIHGSIPP